MQEKFLEPFVCVQGNSKTKAQEVVVCLYLLRRVEIYYEGLVGIYRIFFWGRN